MDILSKTVAFFLFLLLGFMVPMYQYSYQVDMKIEGKVYKETVNFVDNVKNKGFISPQMYLDFVNQLKIDGYNFDVKMIHSRKVYTPVYDNNGNFQNDYKVQDDKYFNRQIGAVLFPNTTAKKNDGSRLYKLEVGDTFDVTVTNNGTSIVQLMRSWIGYTDGQAKTVYAQYGGMVNNEDY